MKLNLKNENDNTGLSTHEWLQQKLYPLLFEKLNKAFPELKLKRHDILNWRSQIYINDLPKTVVTNQDGSYWILGHDGEVTNTLVDYVMDRDNINYYEAVKVLAKAVGLNIPDDAKKIISANKKRNKAEKRGIGFSFDLEVFFRIALGSVAIFFGIIVVSKGTWGGLLLCALGIMIMAGIKRQYSTNKKWYEKETAKVKPASVVTFKKEVKRTPYNNEDTNISDDRCNHCGGLGWEYYCSTCYSKALEEPSTEKYDGDLFCPNCAKEDNDRYNIKESLCSICEGTGKEPYYDYE